MPTGLHVRFTSQRVVIDLSWIAAFKTFLCIGVALLAGLLPIPGLDQTPPRVCLVIFVGAAALWITELIPPYATAIMVMVLSVYLLGAPANPAGAGADGSPAWQVYVNPIASPVLVLFFGGFVLALGATKHGFDVRLARAFITPFGNRPSRLLLGIIGTTALFSMFMSNTATTAMMIAIAGPILHQLGDQRKQFRQALVLAIPFSANIGGIGTIIGTPPNAVAASVLQRLGPGHEISFLGWAMIGVPVVCVMLLLLWLILLSVFRPQRAPLDVSFPDALVVTPGLAIVVLTFTTTVLLWLTQPLHHIPPAVVAMIPIAIFTAFNILDRNDLKQLDWDVMILVAGGLTLGVAMRESGLSSIIVSQVPFERLHTVALLGAVMVLSIVISNFMSNTSAANLLLPIVCSISTLEPRIGALAVALSASLAMSLPISTPPNAIAFATRALNVRDMAKYGTLISILGLALLMALFTLFGPAISGE